MALSKPLHLLLLAAIFLSACTFKAPEARKPLTPAEQADQEKRERINAGNDKFKDECYNPVDGSCYAVVHYVKQNMNDPESFQHDRTVYTYTDSCIIVDMKFRGNNAFGGKVINYVTAKVSRDCELLEIKKLRQ